MKNILIIANTYYQLIIAIQLRSTIFSGDYCVLLLSDKSKNADTVVDSIKKQGVFSECYYVKNRELIQSRTIVKRIEDLFDLSFGVNNRYAYYLKDVCEKRFDELIMYNYNIDIIGVYCYLYEHNNEIIVSFMEEGIFSYSFRLRENIGRRLIRTMRHFTGKKMSSDVLKNFYCLYPKVYNGQLLPVGIPCINNSSPILDTLKNVFKIDNATLNYERKYILFTGVWDFEGGDPIGEYEVFCKVAEIVGKENIIIKIHPRDRRTIYADNGFMVDINSGIPWEVLQLSGDFSSKVLIATTSGSVMAGSLFTSDRPQIYYLFPLCNCDRNEGAQKNVQSIKELFNNEEMTQILDNVTIVDNIEMIR